MTTIIKDPISIVTSSGLELLINIDHKSKDDRKYHGIMYVFHTNEDIVDNLFNRHNRPNVQYREQILPEVCKSLDIPNNVKFTWSQKAGCKCPCSPGFLISDPDCQYTNYIISVDVKGFNNTNNREEALAYFNKQVWGVTEPEIYEQNNS